MTKEEFALSFQWPTQEPFLFCVHHRDAYPKGMPNFGPGNELLHGRNLGQDFVSKDGFRMYHGKSVPGFPAHPHRGFETITIVRRGYVDHADSLGSIGRYGEGDVQWMTAGAGVQHSEMFPLLHQDQENPMELFQIWLNLPLKNKMVQANYKMLWSEEIPEFQSTDGRVNVEIISGSYRNINAIAPPKDSWANDPDNEVTVLLVRLNSGGTFDLPGSRGPTNRSLYYFSGDGLQINDRKISPNIGMKLDGREDIHLKASSDNIEILILQARPIGEPIVQHGPFVMTSREEIMQAFEDYRKTEFGGWPWPKADIVHGGKLDRFSQSADGKVERPRHSAEMKK
jgi:redox-sensitive bicupin YhaK (pirin superfamily)